MTETREQWVGQSVNGKFCLRRYLGGSEHSAVFLIDYDDREPQSAVIKLIPENAPDAERQLDSWRLAATVLSHPHLIQLFQAGRCKIGDVKLVYVVMECADEDLSQIIPQRPLTDAEATDVLKPALDAIAHIHAKGSIHGRIKPANVMACGEQLKLSSDGLRRAGDPIGNPGPYDPPEAAASSAGDVWSLGMALVEVVTQRLPIWNRNAEEDPVLPNTLSAPILDIARNCLRRDPKRRWTINDIASRLNPVAAMPELPKPIEPAHTTVRPRYLIPAALVLLLIVAAVVGLKVFNSQTKARPELSATAETTPPPEPGQVENITAQEKDQPVSNEKNLDRVPVAPAPVQPKRPADAPLTKASSEDIVHRVIPDAPQSALDTIQGTVRVSIRVSVAPSGDVSQATIDSPGPSKYFAKLAQRAAQQWKFAPAPGKAGDWILRFEFSNAGAKVYSARATP